MTITTKILRGALLSLLLTVSFATAPATAQVALTKPALVTELAQAIFTNGKGGVTASKAAGFIADLMASLCGLGQAADCVLPPGVVTATNLAAIAAAHNVYIGPTSGGSGTAAFRTLLQADLPAQLFNSSGYSEVVVSASGVPAYSPVFNAAAANITPANSATLNATNLQTLFTAAAAAGGRIEFPRGCGDYAFNATPSMTVTTPVRVGLRGGGPDCTRLNFQGPIDGPTFAFTHGQASFDIEGLALTTDQAGGGHKALVTQNLTGNGNTFGASNVIRDVAFRGADFYGSSPSADYWSTGWYETGINNVNVYNENCQQANQAAITASQPQNGDCNVLQGSGVGSGPGQYSVITNFFGLIAFGCANSVHVLDWYQGLSVIGGNSTVCGKGVNQSLTSPAGLLTEFQIIGGQWADYGEALDMEAANVAGIEVTGAQINVLSGPALKIQGTQYSLTGIIIACNTPNGTIGVQVASAFAQGGSWTGGAVAGCGQGLNVPPGASALLDVQNVRMFGNGYAAFTGAISGTTLTVSGYTAPAPLVFGTFLNGAGLTPGTNIVGFGTGTGGNGTYTVNASQTISSEAMSAQWLGPSPFDYVIGAGASGVKITDHQNRLFSYAPPCNSATLFSEFVVLDSVTNTFDAAVVGGGANDGRIICSASAGGYTFH